MGAGGVSNVTWDFLSSDCLMPIDARLDSPIERAFYRCFLYVASGVPERMKIEIQSQVVIGEYRVDFLLLTPNGRNLCVIECDGHDFHERTKEQAARDKSRDRDLLMAGLPVLRYTGSEVYQRPFECALTAYQFAIDKAGVG